jgi:Bacterial PH domain
MAADDAVNGKEDPGGRQVFRSPAATAIWWVWVLFAVANLIDLAVQGRDHLSVVAAFILLLITGVVYVTARRPRVIADPAGLTVSNPVRDHRVDWAAVADVESTDLLRIRCEWPEGDATAKRVIYAWAVHSSRRRQIAAERRVTRQAHGAGGGFGIGGFTGGRPARGYATPPDVPEPASLGVDADLVVATLTTRAEQAREDEPAIRAAAPASSWHWPAVAAILIPALALLIAVLA